MAVSQVMESKGPKIDALNFGLSVCVFYYFMESDGGRFVLLAVIAAGEYRPLADTRTIGEHTVTVERQKIDSAEFPALTYEGQLLALIVNLRPNTGHKLTLPRPVTKAARTIFANPGGQRSITLAMWTGSGRTMGSRFSRTVRIRGNTELTSNYPCPIA